MVIVRSFDVNKPGSGVDEMKGGVISGSILKGVVKVNQFIEISPGIVVKDENDKIKCRAIYSRGVSLKAEQNELQFAVPGGLIGISTTIDRSLTRSDWSVGQVLREFCLLPEVFIKLEVKILLLSRLLGVKTKGDEKQGEVTSLTENETLMLNVGAMSTGAKVVPEKLSKKKHVAIATTHVSCVH